MCQRIESQVFKIRTWNLNLAKLDPCLNPNIVQQGRLDWHLSETTLFLWIEAVGLLCNPSFTRFALRDLLSNKAGSSFAAIDRESFAPQFFDCICTQHNVCLKHHGSILTEFKCSFAYSSSNHRTFVLRGKVEAPKWYVTCHRFRFFTHLIIPKTRSL